LLIENSSGDFVGRWRRSRRIQRDLVRFTPGARLAGNTDTIDILAVKIRRIFQGVCCTALASSAGSPGEPPIFG
jgi:hypothetical protein